MSKLTKKENGMSNVPMLITKNEGLSHMREALAIANENDSAVIGLAIADFEKQDFEFFEVEITDGVCSFKPHYKENINE